MPEPLSSTSAESAGVPVPASIPAPTAVPSAIARPAPRPEFDPTSQSAPQRGVSYVYMLAAFVVITAGVRMASEILQLLLLSIFIAVVGVPVYEWLVQRKIASWLALLMVISGLLMTTLVVFWIVMTSVADFTARQEDYAEKLRLRTQPLRSLIEKLIPETPAVATPSALLPPPLAKESQSASQQNEPERQNAEPRRAEELGQSPVESAATVPDSIADSGSTEAGNPATQTGLMPTTTDEPDAKILPPSVSPDDELQDPERDHEVLFDREFADGDGWLQPRRVTELPRSRRSWRELIISQFDPAQMISLGASLAHSVSQILGNTTLILLTVVFILLEASTFPSKLRKAFGPAHETQQRYHQIIVSIRSYLLIKTVLSLLTGVLIAGWLWLFGVPYAGLWGMLAFLLNYIPNIGSIIAAIPALMVAWLDLGVLPCVACGIGFVVVNMGIGNILEPRIMGRGMGLSPLVVFCSMVFWGWALGPVGMLLSVPLTMAVRVAMDGFEDTRWLATLLDNPE